MKINFDRVSNLYDSTRQMPGGMAEKVNALIIREGGIKDGSSVLEMGIGTGRIAIPLLNSVKVKYFGIDISSGMMSKVKAKSPTPVHLARADVCKPPFKDASFDAIIAVHIFHLVTGWKDSFLEAKRVLKKGAPILIAGEGGNNWFWLEILAGDMPAETRNKIAEIGRNLNMTRTVGMQNVTEGAEHLKKIGAHVTMSDPIESKMELPLNAIPGLFSARVFSPLWDVPQDVLDKGVKDLTKVLTDHFGNLEKKFTLTRKFDLLKAVFN